MSFYELKVEERNYFYFNKVKKEVETPPHFHGAVELIFCVNGNQEVCVGGEKKILQAGEAYFCDGYTVHSLKSSGAEVYVILGDKHFFQPVFSAFGDKMPPTFFRYANEEFLSLLYAIHQKEMKNAAGRVETNQAIVKLLLAQIGETVPFVKRKEDKQNELVEKILRYVAERYFEDLSLENIALRFGYSRDYLSRVLHRYLGVNWNVYIGGVRARAAHALLNSEKDCSVLDAAFRCGFDSPNTFYRAYRREFGTTPLKNDNF